jgi:hypothetical protein
VFLDKGHGNLLFLTAVLFALGWQPLAETLAETLGGIYLSRGLFHKR